MCIAPTHIVMYDEGIRVNYTAFLLAAFALVGLTVWDVAAFPTIQVEAPDRLTRDAMFMGGATILGLVAFGSLLNMLFIQAKPPYGKRITTIFASGVTFGFLGSFFLMLTAYGVFSIEGGFGWSMGLIFVGVLLIVLAAARVFDVLFDHRKQDDPS